MAVTQLAGLVMIVFGGLFTGAIFTVAVERVNLWRRMPVDQYAVDFRRSLYRLDPLVPIMGAISGTGAVVFALNSRGHSAGFTWIAVSLIAVIMVGSIIVAEPMNAKFRHVPEGEVPDDVEQLRSAWRRFHRVRTMVALGAFFCLSCAVV